MSQLDQYDYALPNELIAQLPLPCRSDARLLVVQRADQSLRHAHVRDLPEILRAGDLLVLNDTRVLPARLVGHRARTGGRWQGLFLSTDASGIWQLMCKTRGKLVTGETIVLHDSTGREAARLRMLVPLGNGTWAARPETSEGAWELLERVGRIPLPPYIRRGEARELDREAYQTVYASQSGSVAAPTAGLHFTRPLLQHLEAAGIRHRYLTLHVGRGTFRPINSLQLGQHRMDREWCCVTADLAGQLQQTRSSGGRVVAVGSTVVRALESAAAGGPLQPWSGETDLFIRPPYTFRAVDALMTNFHLPRTTLLVLVRTFGTDELIRRAYDEAIRERYRFYSYGDAMLVL